MSEVLITEEQLKKLAVIANVSLFSHEKGMRHVYPKDWRPHKDIAQAYEALNALITSFDNEHIYYRISGGRKGMVGSTSFMHIVTLETDTMTWWEGEEASTLPLAICKAVLRATKCD